MKFLCALTLFFQTSNASSQELNRPHEQTCRIIERMAANNGLPVDFFARLIWQESKFDPQARSPAGAVGIAQFMPSTAASRGAFDPLNIEEALRESAGYLSELRKTFNGNLGLAAAAYNGGPTRVNGWLKQRNHLPRETINYVQIVTGYSVSEWAGPKPPEWQPREIPKEIPCTELVTLLAETSEKTKRENPAWQPWGVQVAGNWQQGQVLASFERLRRQYPEVIGERQPLVLRSKLRNHASRYVVRLGEPSRSAADELCMKIQTAGGACLVLANQRR